MNIAAARRGEVKRRWESAAAFVFLAVLSMMAAAYAAKIFQVAHENVDRLDFSHYYTSSYLLRRGINPYAIHLAPIAVGLGFEAQDIDHATNPPALVLLLEPLTLFRPHVAYWVWFAINVGFLASFFALAIAEFNAGLRVGWALVCLTLIYPPLVINFHYAQAQIIILVLLMLALRFLRRQRYSAAGAMIALATLIKVFPIIVAGYFIARRRWKPLGYVLAWGAIGGALTVWATGFDICIGFVRASAFITSTHWLVEAGNISINGFILRSIGFAIAKGAGRGWLQIFHPMIVCVEFGVFAMTIVLSWRGNSGDQAEACAFGLWIVAATVLSPTSWVHYLVLLLIPLWLIAISVAEGRASRPILWAAAAIYFLTYATTAEVEQTWESAGLDTAVFIWNQLRFAAPVLAYIATYLLMREASDEPSDASI